ncbi:MAG: hypothetical protein ACRC2K_12025 [Clostridium sp.]
MSYEKLLKNNYQDIANMASLLKTVVDSYRLLIGGAAELNTIAPVKKSSVEAALKRVNEVGEIIDEIIDAIEKSSEGYLKYCKVKNEIIVSNIDKNIILTEIEDELNFNN